MEISKGIKLKKNIYVSCPRCVGEGRNKQEGVQFGFFKVNELNKVYNFECSVCETKIEYIINAMPKITLLDLKK